MRKNVLLMSCAFGALVLSGQGAYAAAAAATATTTAADTGAGTTIGELVVTAERRETNLQDTPIAVSAFSAASLKAMKIEGGDNLVLQVPNTNYSRSNFGGFNFKIRGIGVDVIAFSGTTGVSINLNELPVAINNFANSEFFDVDRVEVLRGPQGTLYGRNATGGAVDIITTKPSQTFGGWGSAEYGNYNTIKMSGAVNLPLGDAFALRVAGIKVLQGGFGENIFLNERVDGRDLGAIRATLSFKPSDRFSAYLLYENYSEDDTRNRVGKQLCIKDPGPKFVGNVPIAPAGGPILGNYAAFLNQGCLPGSLYQDAAYGTPNSNATFLATGNLVGLNNGTDVFRDPVTGAPQMQNHNLHDIQSVIQPLFKSNEQLVDFHMAYNVTDTLTLTNIFGFNQTTGASAEDYNRVVPESPFTPVSNGPFGGIAPAFFPNGVVKDPQTGTSNLLTTFDYGTEQAKEYTDELRLTSSFKGKFNFSIGGFYSEQTSHPGAENYFVESNALLASAVVNNVAGGALLGGPVHISGEYPPDGSGHQYYDARSGGGFLKTYAGFGEVYYEFTPTVKLTLGGRYNVDQLQNFSYPISVLVGQPNGTTIFPNNPNGPYSPFNGGWGGFPPTVCNTSLAACLIQQDVTYRAFTGRVNLDWTPTLSFTDKTLVYATYSRGYKGGGFNTPCQSGLGTVGTVGNSCPYPLQYGPEYINAYEVGTKNTLLNGTLTLNGDFFYYDYKGYQVSTIVAKSSVNQNINTKLYGVEFEGVWAPVRNLTLNTNIGFLHSSIDSGQFQVDQMNLDQGHPEFTLIHGADGTACLAPTALIASEIGVVPAPFLGGFAPLNIPNSCLASGVKQFGIPVDLSGKKMPNAPEFTVSVGAQYVFELPDDWRATLRGDFYWQDSSFARIFNAVNDQLNSYENVNATLTFSNVGQGLDLQLFVKNAFNSQPITGVYLTNDTSGLFQNVFTLDPRTYGVQLTKRF
jgi:outer membrane receptor protein involved in Fe transport